MEKKRNARKQQEEVKKDARLLAELIYDIWTKKKQTTRTRLRQNQALKK